MDDDWHFGTTSMTQTTCVWERERNVGTHTKCALLVEEINKQTSNTHSLPFPFLHSFQCNHFKSKLVAEAIFTWKDTKMGYINFAMWISSKF